MKKLDLGDVIVSVWGHKLPISLTLNDSEESEFPRSSVQFSCSVVSNSLWPHQLQHTGLPCPSPTPGACSTNSWSLFNLLLIKWVMPSNHLILCHPLLLPSMLPSIRVFSNELALCIRWPKYWASASASVLPVNIQDWFPLGWTGFISLQSKELARAFSNTTVWKHQFLGTQPSLQSNSHIYTWPLEKP